MEIVYRKTSELVPYANNARTHTDEQVAQICASIREYGWTNPVLIDEEGTIIAGHGRVMAAGRLGMDEVPCIVLTGLTKAQKKAYAIADNKMALNAGWDDEKLALELDSLKELDFDLSLTGFDDDKELDGIFGKVGECESAEDDFDGEPTEEPKAKPGDVYLLGRHRLMCGDSTKPEDVEKLMDGNKADMVFTDPPYGMKKEKDGVENDNLNYDDLLEFNKKWIPLSFDALKDASSWYCWGIDEPLMDIYSEILKPMKRKNQIVIRNYITWAKHGAFGVNSSQMLSYPRETEKCWFVVKGQDWNNNNADFFDTKYEKILAYMQEEAKKIGISANDIKRITGVGMYSHWFTKSQFCVIPQKHYEELRGAYPNGFKKPHKELLKLMGKSNNPNKKPQFDLTWFKSNDIGLTDVWRESTTKGEERESAGGHATPKPISICMRAIKSSSKEGDIVLDLFGGSGSTLIACEQSGRSAYLMELEPRWADVIIKRWEDFTGKKAVLLEEGVRAEKGDRR